jgi:transposase
MPLRLSIHLQREIARLHFYDKRQSSRAIGRMVGVSHNSVKALRQVLAESGRLWPELSLLDDHQWRSVLNNHDKSVAQKKITPDWNWVHEQMQREDGTLEVIWCEWREGCPEGVGYSAFTEHYRRWRKSLHIVMRQHHAPGDKIFVDFAGRTVEVRDPLGGPSSFAQIFVAVLGYSNLTYLEAVPSQKVEHWQQCHVNCFAALGGVPHWIVCDNLKSAVLRRTRDRIDLNPAYRECLAHYDTAVLPTRVRKPQDKGKVEVGVQIAQRWVLFRLRDRVFFSYEELNQELRRLTADMNAHPFKKMTGSRIQRFKEVEVAALKPLPNAAFEPCQWKRAIRVNADYHVEHEGGFYSVPYHLIGKKVDTRFTEKTLEIFESGKRVAFHALELTSVAMVTLQEHRPIAHQRVLDAEPKALLEWAKTVGANTHAMLSHHLQDRSDMVNGIRAAKRLRELARLHGESRLEEVCAYSLPLNITALRSIQSIFRNQPDRQAPPLMPPAAPHENLRGPSYYGGNP